MLGIVEFKIVLTRWSIWRPGNINNLLMIRQTLDLEKRILGVELGLQFLLSIEFSQSLWVFLLRHNLRWTDLIFHDKKHKVFKLLLVFSRSQRARSHDSCKQTLKSKLTNEFNEIGRQSEWHELLVPSEIILLQIIHLSRLQIIDVFLWDFDSWLREAQSAARFTERHRAQWLELTIVEDVGEEGISRMVSSEPFLKQEEVIHIVKDPVEIRTE